MKASAGLGLLARRSATVATIVTLAGFGLSWNSKSPPPQPTSPFEAIDIWVDPMGQTLSGYQVVVRSLSPESQLVAVEGGDGAYAEPPHYDPRALQRDTAVELLAYRLDGPLPDTATRVCTLHFFHGESRSHGGYEAKDIVAVNRNGEKIPIQVKWKRR